MKFEPRKIHSVTVDMRQGPTVPFPIYVNGSPLSRPEAQALLEALDDALNFDPTPYVQVTVDGSVRYTYRDPSGTLAVGDAVQVPFGARDRLRFGTVAALGRGSYPGKVKDVAARVVTEPLTA